MDETDANDAPNRGNERLWTPWRMRYVGGGAAEPGCLFCNRLAADDDVRSLILHRGDRVFVIMNLFPYNTGHVMIVPNEHVATPEQTEPATLAAIGELLRPLLRALRRVLNADGFNIGFNVGAVAGAGVADHLHQHVVPRWQGDANFMPILASTMVLPELIPVTYAKLRAELGRELSSNGGSHTSVVLSVLSPDRSSVLLTESGRLPAIEVQAEVPIWKAAAGEIRAWGVDLSIMIWAGSPRAVMDEPIALGFLAEPDQVLNPSAPVDWVKFTSSRSDSSPDRKLIERTTTRLSSPAV
jgi:ATP adenylyltransferase